MCILILNVLKSNETAVSAKFKHWVRQCCRLIAIGSSELIYNIKNNLPLISHENL